MECEICGCEARLVEAISEDKVVSVCEKCVFQNGFPVIRKPTLNQIRDMSRFRNVRERLNEQAGINDKKHKNKEVDKELEKVVTENLSAGEKEDLVENYHWIIQSARRRKKISQKQLAEEIAEPEILIKMAEEAKLPENYAKFIGKLEQFLGVKLLKENKFVGGEGAVDLGKVDWGTTKLKDLKEIHDKKFSNGEKEKKQALLDEVAEKLGDRRKKRFWENS